MNLAKFQMVDRIGTINEDVTSLMADSVVPAESTIFEGHFPDLPLVPGVLLIETMAQTSGYMIMARTKFTAMPYLVGVKDSKLRTFIIPETPLNIVVEMVHDGSGFAKTKGSITSEGKRVCSAELTFKTMNFPDEKFAQTIINRAREIHMPERFLP